MRVRALNLFCAREREIERERNSNREKVILNPISLLQARFNTSLRLLRSLSRVLVVVLRDDCCSIVVSRDEKLFLGGIKFTSERGTKRYVCVRVCEKRVPKHTGVEKSTTYTMISQALCDTQSIQISSVSFRFLVLVRSLSQRLCF